MKPGKSRDRLARHLEIMAVFFDAHALISNRFGGGESGPGSGERVQYYPLSEWQDAAYNLPQECLWFKAGVWRDRPLFFMSWGGLYDIAKRFIRRRAAETACPPLAEVVLNPSFNRSSE